jgi:hypothetical protein
MQYTLLHRSIYLHLSLIYNEYFALTIKNIEGCKRHLLCDAQEMTGVLPRGRYSGATAPLEDIMADRADAAPINRKPYVAMGRQVKGLAVLPSANNCQGSLEKAQPVGMASRIRLNSDAKPTAHTELVALAWAGSLADQARSYPVQSMVQTLVSLTDTEGGRGLTTSSESGSLLHRMSLRLAPN